MRLIVLIIIVLLVAFVSWRQLESVSKEETVNGEQMTPLRKAQQLEQKDYFEALDKHRERLDAQEEADGP